MINTDLDEESPFMSADGKTIFFSSKGHFNMGGFDVFYSNLNKYNQFEEAVNVGFPVNTTNDNIGYYPIKDGKTAYMTLFGDNNLGEEDIYKLEILPFTAPQVSVAPQFDKPFKIKLTDIDSNEKIEVIYDNKTDQFKVKSSTGKVFNVTAE